MCQSWEFVGWGPNHLRELCWNSYNKGISVLVYWSICGVLQKCLRWKVRFLQSIDSVYCLLWKCDCHAWKKFKILPKEPLFTYNSYFSVTLDDAQVSSIFWQKLWSPHYMYSVRTRACWASQMIYCRTSNWSSICLGFAGVQRSLTLFDTDMTLSCRPSITEHSKFPWLWVKYSQ